MESTILLMCKFDIMVFIGTFPPNQSTTMAVVLCHHRTSTTINLSRLILLLNKNMYT